MKPYSNSGHEKGFKFSIYNNLAIFLTRRSIVEYYFKNDELGDPIVSEEHITAFGWATSQELDDMLSMSLRINDFLSGLLMGIGIRLIDFKLEFGRLWQGEDMRIVLADEISPDSCRLWDIKSNEKLDKDRFRRDLGNVAEAYQEVARRLGILPESSHETNVEELRRPDRTNNPVIPEKS